MKVKNIFFALYCVIGLFTFYSYANSLGEGQMSVLKGKFDVGMQPQSDTDFDVGRMILDKTYHGDVLGTGKGQMLSHVTNVMLIVMAIGVKVP